MLVKDKVITQAEMRELAKVAYEQAVAIGIPLNKHLVREISVNNRLKKALARCCRKGTVFVFDYNEMLTYGNPTKVIETWIHEWVHTIPGCFNHGEKFQMYIKRANDHYGYKIATKVSYDYLEIPKEYRTMHVKAVDLVDVYCPTCDEVLCRVSKRKGVSKNPGDYLCKICKNKGLQIRGVS